MSKRFPVSFSGRMIRATAARGEQAARAPSDRNQGRLARSAMENTGRPEITDTARRCRYRLGT